MKLTFNQLSSCGINACLNFSSSNGKIFVNLSAEIGEVPLHVPSHPVPPQPKNIKPSRIRRRRRREHSRKMTEANLNNGLSENTESASSNEDEIVASIGEASQVADVDEAIKALESEPVAELNNKIQVSSSMPIPSNNSPLPPDTTLRSCCPEMCCSTKYFSARNCPGPGVSMTTYIRCCLHE